MTYVHFNLYHFNFISLREACNICFKSFIFLVSINVYGLFVRKAWSTRAEDSVGFTCESIKQFRLNTVYCAAASSTPHRVLLRFPNMSYSLIHYNSFKIIRTITSYGMNIWVTGLTAPSSAEAVLLVTL